MGTGCRSDPPFDRDTVWSSHPPPDRDPVWSSDPLSDRGTEWSTTFLLSSVGADVNSIYTNVSCKDQGSGVEQGEKILGLLGFAI